MGKIIAARDGPVLGIDSSAAMFEKFEVGRQS